MRSSRLPSLARALLGLGLGFSTLLAMLVAGGSSALGEEPKPARDKLEAHPLSDAKPGEYLRYKEESDGWKKWFIERILAVREGEVLFEAMVTSEDGTEDKSVIRRGWRKVPKLKPNRRQEIVKDEMVEMEVDGKKLWCRHYVLNEREHPDWPEPKRRKEVWYSNDIPCSGKVKDSLSGRIVTSWGMMSTEELRKRKKAFEDSQKDRQAGPN